MLQSALYSTLTIAIDESLMKKALHPPYYEATIQCSCGALLRVGATQEEMHTEVCSQCHPFYTGKKKVVDTAGRVDRFKKMTEKAQKKQAMLQKIHQKKHKRLKQKQQEEQKAQQK